MTKGILTARAQEVFELLVLNKSTKDNEWTFLAEISLDVFQCRAKCHQAFVGSGFGYAR